MEAKLQITNSTHEAFLRAVMDARRTEPIPISRANEIGKYICSRIRYSNLPFLQNQKTPVNYHLQGFLLSFGNMKVELEGFEPSSKQGTNWLSTCLFCYWFSISEREQTP